MKELTIIQPDDWHLHLRDEEALASVLPHTAAQFKRAVVMPNIKPPITTVEQALAYRQRIIQALPQENKTFEPLMTFYLTDHISLQEIKRAKEAGIVACKLYPAGATTNSDWGVTQIKNSYPALELMQELGLLLLLHGEVTDPEIDVFDREAVFIDRHLRPLRQDFPQLKMVLEHITTSEAVQYVESEGAYLGATVTAHHLLYSRNALFKGGIRPHYYCLPILKREQHRQALIQAATSGHPRFFLGTDSAPHASILKQNASGCAGCYTAHAAIELYATVFEQAGALDRLEGFASIYGPQFYGLPVNTQTVTLQKQEWTVPDSYPLGKAQVIPLGAGETLLWKIKNNSSK